MFHRFRKLHFYRKIYSIYLRTRYSCLRTSSLPKQHRSARKRESHVPLLCASLVSTNPRSDSEPSQLVTERPPHRCDDNSDPRSKTLRTPVRIHSWEQHAEHLSLPKLAVDRLGVDPRNPRLSPGLQVRLVREEIACPVLCDWSLMTCRC